RAHEYVTDRAPSPTLEQRTEAVRTACESMLSKGVTCASDMMTGYSDLEDELEAYCAACLAGSPVRLRLYLQWSPVFGPRAVGKERLDELTSAMDAELCRVAGAKIFADGAISAGTAAIHGEFTSGGDGKLIYEPDRLTEMVLTAHEAGWPVSVHSIGDRSTDHVMDAFAATGEPSRHRIEHAMILSDAQVARLADLGCHVAMQPEFLMRLGHAYFRQLPERTARLLKRAKSCLGAGIRLSFNSDRPIVGGDPWDGIRTAVERPERFDPSENVTLAQAVGAYTRGGADANGDLGLLGEVTEGALADFQVYSGEPSKSAGPDEVYVGGEVRYSKRAHSMEH
ncbi:MAG TPA: amidohydrolase family protein, partial [Fimbriimonadaceae bacterium]|nr:amidohydrolase family protein [Fimbriimonadaceae bacterium]